MEVVGTDLGNGEKEELCGQWERAGSEEIWDLSPCVLRISPFCSSSRSLDWVLQFLLIFLAYTFDHFFRLKIDFLLYN